MSTYTSHWVDHVWDVIQLSDVGHLLCCFRYLQLHFFCCRRQICIQLCRSCSVYSERSCLCEQRNSSMSTRCQHRQDKRWRKQILHIHSTAASTCRSAEALSGDLMALWLTESFLNKLSVAVQHPNVIKLKLLLSFKHGSVLKYLVLHFFPFSLISLFLPCTYIIFCLSNKYFYEKD